MAFRVRWLTAVQNEDKFSDEGHGIVMIVVGGDFDVSSPNTFRPVGLGTICSASDSFNLTLESFASSVLIECDRLTGLMPRA